MSLSPLPRLFRLSLSRGISLTEVMMALVIAGILLALALPSMRSFVIQNRLSAESRQLIAALTLARSEAIQRGRAVSVCRSIAADASAASCSAVASGNRAANDWGAGWLVLSTDNRQILLRQGALYSNTQVISSRNAITYSGSGNASGNNTNLLFSNNGEFARRLCIGMSGRIRVQIGDSVC